jgi:hypothetical protein
VIFPNTQTLNFQSFLAASTAAPNFINKLFDNQNPSKGSRSSRYIYTSELPTCSLYIHTNATQLALITASPSPTGSCSAERQEYKNAGLQHASISQYHSVTATLTSRDTVQFSFRGQHHSDSTPTASNCKRFVGQPIRNSVFISYQECS